MARSITQFSPTSHTLPITRKVARFSVETRRELHMDPSPMTSETIADARRAQRQDRISVLAGLGFDYSPDVPDAVRHLLFEKWPQDVQARFIRRAKIYLGLLDTTREQMALQAATRSLAVGMEHGGTPLQLVSTFLGVYFDVLALEPQAHDPRRI